MDNYILAYYQAIRDGSVTVGRWVRLAYEMIVRGLESGEYQFSQKKANAAIRFVERFCHHHEGALAPQRIRLELWQKALISCIFGVIDHNGARQFRTVFLVIARKNGKTLLAAAIAEYMTLIDGEYGARIYFAAPKLEQANLCYDAYWQMILQEPEIAGMAKKRRTEIYFAQNNATARSLAFSAKKSDGLNISCGIADEIASWPGAAGLRFFEVMLSSMGARRQPLMLAITTAGYENDGVYDELMKRSTRVLLGDSSERRLLPLLYMIDDPGKWNDINELRKSNPNLGVSVSVEYLVDEITVAETSLPKKREFLTKYCNLKQNTAAAWLSVSDVEKCRGKELRPEDFRNSYCVGGIDLSQTRDLTACCVIIEREERLNVLAQFFMPRERIDEAIERDGVPYDLYVKRGLLTLSGDNYVDYHDCFDWFRRLVEEYQIFPLQVGYDRYSAQYLVQDMKAYGYHMDDVYQGENLWPVLQEMEGMIADGRVNIGDNDLLAAHLLNAAIKMSTERGRGKLIKVNPTLHIDGAAALADGFTVRQKWAEEIGEQLKNEG